MCSGLDYVIVTIRPELRPKPLDSHQKDIISSKISLKNNSNSSPQDSKEKLEKVTNHSDVWLNLGIVWEDSSKLGKQSVHFSGVLTPTPIARGALPKAPPQDFVWSRRWMQWTSSSMNADDPNSQEKIREVLAETLASLARILTATKCALLPHLKDNSCHYGDGEAKVLPHPRSPRSIHHNWELSSGLWTSSSYNHPSPH